MRYIKIKRDEYEGFITIGEYILKTDPETFKQLHRTYLIKHDIGQYLSKPILVAFTRNMTEQVKQLMTERPKPGRGGLLPGEAEEDLWGGDWTNDPDCEVKVKKAFKRYKEGRCFMNEDRAQGV